jgi:glutathione S-transferase
MKIYYDAGRAPNPRRVKIFLAEKRISVPVEQVDLAKLEHRTEGYAAINPMRRVPTLVLDDGTAIAESMAICRYFEAISPDPPLFGKTPLDIAQIEMWNRRAELHLYVPVSTVFQHLHPAMKALVDPQIPAWGEANRPRIFHFLELLDGELSSRAFLAGNNFTIADITALVAVDFMKVSKLAVPDELAHVRRWYGDVSARPSAKA